MKVLTMHTMDTHSTKYSASDPVVLWSVEFEDPFEWNEYDDFLEGKVVRPAEPIRYRETHEHKRQITVSRCKNDPLVDWLYLNPEGRQRFMEQEETVHAEPGSIDWNWKEIPYNRVALMNLIASRRENCRYLEIGCDKDVLFHAMPLEDKTGIDPVSGGNLRMTSDEFYSKNQRQYDLIFIDGLHTYDQVRRDVINALSTLAPGGWIGLHDMLPRNWKEQHVPRIQGAWTGDVWKVAFELARTNGIDFRIVQIDHGVGLVRRSDVSAPQLVDLREELSLATFSYFHRNYESLPLISWKEAHSWISNG